MEPARCRKAARGNGTRRRIRRPGRWLSERCACAIPPDAPSGSCPEALLVLSLLFVLYLLPLTDQPLPAADSMVLSASSWAAIFVPASFWCGVSFAGAVAAVSICGWVVVASAVSSGADSAVASAVGLSAATVSPVEGG